MNTNRAYIVAVDMGYGHQRAAFPLLNISAAPEGWDSDEPMIISANNYPGIPRKDKLQWTGMRTAYELISRSKETIPVLGEMMFATMDYFQKIEPFYPARDLSKPTLQLTQFYRQIKGGFGKHLIDELNRKPLPLLTTFFIAAFFAEEHGYKGPIYCLCTDSDVSRAWAPLHPEKSRIIYLAPNKRVRERLKLYGVKEENIVITGFPLPKELTGDRETIDVLKSDLKTRIDKLDPRGIYHTKFKKIIDLYLNDAPKPVQPNDPVSITYAVGGAGAQKEIGVHIIRSLRDRIVEGKVRLNLVVGIHNRIFRYYESALQKLNLYHYLGDTVHILYDENKFEYFRKFNELLHHTDILWTKPSELSFYSGLGIPILMSPPIGSQEKFNRAWLRSMGAGLEEEHPNYIDEWLTDWLDSGTLAEAAMSGFLHVSKKGTYHIEDLILHGKRTEIEDIHLL